MGFVRDKFGELKEVIGIFNGKVSDVLSKAEVQFLQAYRAHMQAVYAEKQELEAKLREAEAQQANDQQIRALEKDVEWYKSQKNQLEGQTVAMQKDLLFMQEQYEVLNKDRKMLSTQLKAVKKQERLLKIENAGDDKKASSKQTVISTLTPSVKTPTSLSTHKEDGDKTSSSKKKKKSTTLSTSSHVSSVSKPEWGRGGGNNVKNQASMISEFTSSDINHDSQNKKNGGMMTDEWQGADSNDYAMKRKLRMEKEKLLMERAELQRLRSLVVDDKSLRSELETFYLQAVEDLRKESERNRNRPFSSLKGLPNTGTLLHNKDEENDLAILFDCLFPGQ
jgi:hypothetical protein